MLHFTSYISFKYGTICHFENNQNPFFFQRGRGTPLTSPLRHLPHASHRRMLHWRCWLAKSLYSIACVYITIKTVHKLLRTDSSSVYGERHLVHMYIQRFIQNKLFVILKRRDRLIYGQIYTKSNFLIG